VWRDEVSSFPSCARNAELGVRRIPLPARELAADRARELGLMDSNGSGSWTHPDLTRMLHADE